MVSKKFCGIGLETLNIRKPCKQKYIRSNQIPFFTKELSKAIVARSRLRYNYFKNRNDTNRLLYIKQRNYCVLLLRKIKKTYYANFYGSCVTDNKLFWQTVKSFLSDKVMTRGKIYLTKNGKIIKTDKKQRTI